jgi:TonB family protein
MIRLPLWLTTALLGFGIVSAQQEPASAESFDDTVERIPLNTVVPLYPEKARRSRVEGDVEVCFKVDRQGNTSQVAVRHSSNRVFEKPSMDAIKGSTYKPLPTDKEISGIKTCRTFRFYLNPVSIEELSS